MTLKEYEQQVEQEMSVGTNKLVFMNGGQVANDGWWTLRQDPRSSNYATKVKCTEWGHVVMVGDIVDIVLRGRPMDSQEAIRWIATSDLSYLASKCQIREQAYEYSKQVAVNSIKSHLDDEREIDPDDDIVDSLTTVLLIVRNGETRSFPREAEDLWYGELQMERCPGEVPSRAVITARLIARRMLVLWNRIDRNEEETT
jgi:hypothetical protein